MYYIMSVFLRKFPLQRLPLKKCMSCQYPGKYDIFSTTFKVNSFTAVCAVIINGAILKTAGLIRDDIFIMRGELNKLSKK